MFVGQDISQKLLVDSLMLRQFSLESNGQFSVIGSKSEVSSNKQNLQQDVVKTNKCMLKEDGKIVSDFRAKMTNTLTKPAIVDEIQHSKPSFDSPIHRKKVSRPIAESDFKPEPSISEVNIPFWYSANSKTYVRGGQLDKSDTRLFQNKKSTQNELRNSVNVMPGKDFSKHLNIVSSTDKSPNYNQKTLNNAFQKKSSRCKNENKLMAKTLYPDQFGNNTQITTPKTHQKKFSFDVSKPENANLRIFQKGIFGNDDSKGDASTKSKKDSASFFSGMASSFVKSTTVKAKKNQESGPHARLNGAHSIETDHSSKHRPKFL